MGEEGVEHELWNEDDSWAFPVIPVENNGGKMLIEGGKILTDVGMQAAAQKVVDQQTTDDKGKGKKKKRAAAAEADDHELHIWTERERRKKMRDMFATLHALIPHLHPRADKSSIVDEAVVYIKQLQQTMENLEKLKQEKLNGGGGGNASLTACDVAAAQSREAFLAEQGSTSTQPPPVPLANPNPIFPGQASFTTWTSPNVVLNVCGIDAHINIVVCYPAKPGIFTTLVFVLDKFKLDLVSAHVSSNSVTRNYMIHARANGIPAQFPEAAFLVEETYKQAAAELMLWINS